MSKWPSIYHIPDAPCKDCDHQYTGCHSKCKDYIAYQEEREADKQERRKAQAIAEVRYWASSRKQSSRRRIDGR